MRDLIMGCGKDPRGERLPAHDGLCGRGFRSYGPRDREAAEKLGCRVVFAIGVRKDAETGERFPDESSAFCCPE